MSQFIQRILFPTDFSSCAEGAYRHAAWLALRFGAELHVLHVVESEAAPERAWPEEPGTGHLQITLTDVCEDLGLPAPVEAGDDSLGDSWDDIELVETEVVGRDPAEAILDVAADEDVDLVVMGTHGRRGWRRGALGSVAEAVARRAPCPVLTVRPLDAPGGVAWPPRRVLAAVDGETLGLDAGGAVLYDDPVVPASVLWAARLAVAYGAPLDLLYVAPVARLTAVGPHADARARTEARQRLIGMSYMLRDALADDSVGGLRVHIAVRSGPTAETIDTVAAENGAHLLVVGTHGRQGAGRVLLGSVAETVTRTAPCPVLVVRNALTERDRPSAEAVHAKGVS